MSDPLPAPSFNLQYNVQPMNLGEVYAKGMEAGTKAAQPISDAISAVGQNLYQNRNADDALAAMVTNKMITPDEYNAVAGKSLGAKQQLLGMYASEYSAQQAQQRALALQQGQGAAQIGVEHAKYLDTLNMLRQGYNPSGDPSKMPYRAPAPQKPVVARAAVVPPGQSIGPTSTQSPGMWAPGSQIVQVNDAKTGGQIHAIKLPSGQLLDVNTKQPLPGQ